MNNDYEFKSPGPNELYPRVLNGLIEELLETLSIIFPEIMKDGWSVKGVEKD